MGGFVENSVPTEDEALAAWCAHLPAVREEAAKSGATARLERDIARIRTGGPALTAWRKWLSTTELGSTRSWSEPAGAAMAGLPGPSQVKPVGTGAYRCPMARCARQASRDAEGHPPVCTAFDTPMIPAGR